MTPHAELEKSLANFARGSADFAKTQFSILPREELKGSTCDVIVVFHENGDVIFQLFPKAQQRLLHNEAARTLLAEMIDVYFGSTDNFSADYVDVQVPGEDPFQSWTLRAARFVNRPAYSKDYHVYGFAQFINQALADIKE